MIDPQDPTPEDFPIYEPDTYFAAIVRVRKYIEKEFGGSPRPVLDAAKVAFKADEEKGLSPVICESAARAAVDKFLEAGICTERKGEKDGS